MPDNEFAPSPDRTGVYKKWRETDSFGRIPSQVKQLAHGCPRELLSCRKDVYKDWRITDSFGRFVKDDARNEMQSGLSGGEDEDGGGEGGAGGIKVDAGKVGVGEMVVERLGGFEGVKVSDQGGKDDGGGAGEGEKENTVWAGCSYPWTRMF